jgi:LAO/AO transport system kinase
MRKRQLETSGREQVVTNNIKSENFNKNMKKLSIEDYYKGIIGGDRIILSRALTLIESSAAKHRAEAEELLLKIMPYTGESIRIGITGPPGVGKSTFIDTFGTYLIEEGHKVAVLSIDPSSSISGGSILGDKTRMEKLAVLQNAFIRPTPSGGTLGGVARKTRESILLCEAAGYNVILVETVGVGQNELTVNSMVDFFMLMQIAGAGDELQGIKKGVVELADAIVINKADGGNKKNVAAAVNIIKNALDYLQPVVNGWKTEVLSCSAMAGEGIKEIWHVVTKFRNLCTENNEFSKKREHQLADWFDSLLNDEIKRIFFADENVKKRYSDLKKKVMKGRIPAVQAVRNLINTIGK